MLMSKKIKISLFIGLLVIVSMIYFVLLVDKINYQSDLSSGIIQDIKVGDILSKEAVALQPIDIEVDLKDQEGPIKIYLWDFDVEDGDYVQIFVNGMAHTEAFLLKNKAVKVSVPSKGTIQIKGSQDGDEKGITYGVSFEETGEKYLNAAPLNGVNTYTLKSNN